MTKQRRTRRPRVTLNCVADRYHGAGERIVEFFDNSTRKGGLISLRPDKDGNLVVDVYRCDPGVIVRGPQKERDDEALPAPVSMRFRRGG